MKRTLSMCFAFLAVAAMVGAVCVRLVQVRTPATDHARPDEWCVRAMDPKVHLSRFDGRVEWAETASGSAQMDRGHSPAL